VRGIRERGKTVFLTTHLMEEAERLCDRVAIIEHGRIIDIDTPERLVARHCPEQTVVLATDDPRVEERFRTIPGVQSVVRADLRIVPTARFAQPIGAAIMYPMIGLSGLFLPVALLPPVVHTMARMLPLTYAVSCKEFGTVTRGPLSSATWPHLL
jgi:hypothetical protein